LTRATGGFDLCTIMTESNMPEPVPAHPDRDRGQQEFVQLLIRHERQLEGFILALVPNWTVAQDIAQETKLRLWEQFGSFDRSRDFGAWARSIAYYQVLSYRTHHKRSREHFFSAEFLDNIAHGEAMNQGEATARQRFLASCLDKLSAKSRKVLLLLYSGKETVRQIANRLGRGEASVYKTVQTSRVWLHQCVEEELRKEQYGD
jgi:RNA polymerase sigma-70 factor, ECF subfamily